MSSFNEIKALTFDTGGTILDWHTGFKKAFIDLGIKYKVERDWSKLANRLRRKSLIAMTNLGKEDSPKYNIDQAHRFILDKILDEESLGIVSEKDRHHISWNVPHSFKCWEDFPENLSILREKYIATSFTVLSHRMIIDTSKLNNLAWDAIFSCEGLKKYKLLPEAYEMTANYLQLKPEEICMVACHPLDLNAAKKVGFKTAMVKRYSEWGSEDPHNIKDIPKHQYDIVVDNFSDLVTELSKS